jgi:hypothetical protein
LRQAEQTQTARISSRVPPDAIPRLLALIAKSADPGDDAEGPEENDGALFGAAEAAGDVLTDADRRGLTPLFHTNMTPYGEIQLRTDRRLDLTDLTDHLTRTNA